MTRNSIQGNGLRARALQEQLAAVNVKMSDIEQVVLTHHHADHAGLLDVFSDEIEVIGHTFNEPYIYNLLDI